MVVDRLVRANIENMWSKCGIPRGQVVEGHYIPTHEKRPLHKMAAVADATSPRLPHQSPSCR
ncbi:hypothetical protein EYF80_012669 [Liparis tanakae]|uniref:Uncharacterized protein n=1 Tax=Liparis tanakae TaxID=230148 RepID=A0A4Z2IH34_9TELE|nr:hypothetical protein EYF80_012669 [Liparis tanakae]